MAHPHENRLRELYATFARGDLAGFLAGCTDDVTFHVPGRTPFSGVHTRATFASFIGQVMAISGGTFREDIVDVFANADHGVLLLEHYFQRDGRRVAYRTAHVVELRDGKLARWEEWPGSLAEFDAAWS